MIFNSGNTNSRIERRVLSRIAMICPSSRLWPSGQDLQSSGPYLYSLYTKSSSTNAPSSLSRLLDGFRLGPHENAELSGNTKAIEYTSRRRGLFFRPIVKPFRYLEKIHFTFRAFGRAALSMTVCCLPETTETQQNQALTIGESDNGH